MVAVPEYIASGLIDGNCSRTVDRVRPLTGVQGESVKSGTDRPRHEKEMNDWLGGIILQGKKGIDAIIRYCGYLAFPVVESEPSLAETVCENLGIQYNFSTDANLLFSGECHQVSMARAM